MSRFSDKIVFSHSTESFRRGILLCFSNIPVVKNFMDRRWRDRRRGREGVSRFSVKIFLSHSAEEFRRGTLLCFRKFLVLKNVRDTRGGRCHDFPSKTFFLTVPNHFVEPFCVSEISGIEKFYAYEGSITIFCQKFFCLAVPNNFVAELFCAVFQKNSRSDKVTE